MFKVCLSKMSDSGVELFNGIVDVYALEDYELKSNEVKTFRLGKMIYKFVNSVGVPYLKKKQLFKLYHPEGTFKWSGEGQATITVINKSTQSILISKGQYLASVRFMTEAYFKLWRKHNNSDLGLRSTNVEIEIG